jgi:hypothetical protein
MESKIGEAFSTQWEVEKFIEDIGWTTSKT